MANFGMSGFVPGDPSQIVFGLEITEADVPKESAEGFDGIDLVALGANETEAEIFIGILGEPFLAIGGVVVAGVFERVEADIAERAGAALERFTGAAERFRGRIAGIVAGDAADAAQEAREVPAPGG